MATCDNCDAWVSSEFHRVHADNNGILHGCHECKVQAGSFRPDGDGHVHVPLHNVEFEYETE